MSEASVHLSYVPLAHIFERSVLLLCLSSGAAVGFYHGVQDGLLNDLRVLRPTVLCGLPGAFRLLYRKYRTVERHFFPLYRALVRWAWRRKRLALASGARNSQPILDRLFFGDINKSLGGRIEPLLVCDRDLDEEVREFLQVTLGATVLATFGFPEAGGLVALQTLQDDAANAAAGAFGADGDDGQFYRWGARDAVADDVGPPLPCNECKLVPISPAALGAEDDGDGAHHAAAAATFEGERYGELYLRGANSFEGYHGRAHLTAEAYDSERWLKTGYVCTWGARGGLKILGKRNTFLRPEGEQFVSAQRLESIYAHRCPMVHQIWIHSDPSRPLVAVVALDQEALFRWHQAAGVDPRDVTANAPRIAAALVEQLEGVAARCRLQPWERVRAVHVVETLEKGDGAYSQLSTPTFALRRRFLKEQYQHELTRLYVEQLGFGDGETKDEEATEARRQSGTGVTLAPPRPPRNGHAQPDWLSESGEEFRRQLEQPTKRSDAVEHNGWAECLQNAGNSHVT